jgi:hypothetical protein
MERMAKGNEALRTEREKQNAVKGASKNRGGRAAQGCAAILNHGK